jgi:hypothetical protein
MVEIWKQIEGFANYEVSDHGRIRNKTNEKMVKAYEGTGGRMSVTLYNDSQKYGRRLHNLVANAFVLNPDQKEYVYNANCDLRNCRADNLFWISGQECNKLFSQQMVRKEMLQDLKVIIGWLLQATVNICHCEEPPV